MACAGRKNHIRALFDLVDDDFLPCQRCRVFDGEALHLVQHWVLGQPWKPMGKGRHIVHLLRQQQFFGMPPDSCLVGVLPTMDWYLSPP